MSELLSSLSGKSVWIAGHRGMVGSALARRLASEGAELVTADRSELDLNNQTQTHAWLAERKPDVVLLAAAKVGGILANRDHPAEFLYENLAIETNVIHGSWRAGVRTLLFLGSSCIYPKHAPQPMPEDCLLTGSLEETNEWYAIAKIAGLKMCQAYRRQYGVDYRSLMPTNLYGPGDNFSPLGSHVLPALIARFHQAKVEGLPEVTIWGTGSPRREFLHVDDLADATIRLLQTGFDGDWINVGSGQEVSILELAHLIADVVGYEGDLRFDASKPDGTPRKLLDVSRLEQTGWSPRIPLRDGITQVYSSYQQELGSGVVRV